MSERSAGPSRQERAPERSARRDLSVWEAAWVLGESERSVRRMCEQAVVGAWRVVDRSGSSARLRWHIPSEGLGPLLRTELAQRRLRALLMGQMSAPPRSARRGSRSLPVPPEAASRPLFSSDSSSDNYTDERSDTVLSHDPEAPGRASTLGGELGNDREAAANTLREARQVLADLTRAEADHGPTPELTETRRVLEAEIQTLAAALDDWDAWVDRPKS